MPAAFLARNARILLPALAWLLGGGAPADVAHAYAALNVALRFVLATLLWRIFPIGVPQATAAWTLVLFGAGVLFSVRFALSDLAALVLTAAAGLAVERNHHVLAAGFLGLAGLTFVAIHYATGSTWSVAIRRVPEALAGTLPVSIAMLAILFVAHPQLYGWTTEELGSEPAMAFKQLWLSRPFLELP